MKWKILMDFVLNKEFLRKASELLKKHQWEMICRHYIEGMTHREIAAEMGVSHQYVTKGIKKGLHRIRCTCRKTERIEIHCKSDRCISAGGRVSGGWGLRGKLVSGAFGRVCSPGTLR